VREVPRVGGRLTFLSAVPGARYVIVYLRRQLAPVQLVVSVAHELQHAVEIAETPAIVDGRSLAREYTRIGFSNRLIPWATTFDTRAAIDVGEQVLRELRSASARRAQASPGGGPDISGE